MVCLIITFIDIHGQFYPLLHWIEYSLSQQREHQNTFWWVCALCHKYSEAFIKRALVFLFTYCFLHVQYLVSAYQIQTEVIRQCYILYNSVCLKMIGSLRHNEKEVTDLFFPILPYPSFVEWILRSLGVALKDECELEGV